MKSIMFILTLTFLNTTYASVGKLYFEAVGKPAMIKIKGESNAPQTKLTTINNIATLESELDLEHLTTGIDLRDEHMKEKYLETKKYPKAKLIIASLDIPADWAKSPTAISEQEFKGTLNLHGKEAPVKGTFSLNNKKVAEAEFKIKLTDFGIEIPDYLGIKVADLVTIKTQLQLE